MKSVLFSVILLVSVSVTAQETLQQTYCNPVNLDYTYMIYNAHQGISYRSGADPAVVKFRGEYYMFVTRSMGYWHSTDLLNWRFITPEKWYFEGSNAPAAYNYKDSLLYVMGNPSGAMSMLYTTNPQKGDWKATPSILYDLQDPALFLDDDDRVYLYWGSSNTYPIRGKELFPDKLFKPADSIHKLIYLDGNKHGWERFGTNHTDTVLKGYLEGAWMTKHNGKYYLQYAAPGTEFNVYGDGVYMGDHPLGPFTYAPNNPVFYKPGGFANGAGHGSTVEGPAGTFWHFGSVAVSVNVNWERRICLYPAYFDKDGWMYSNTAYGDYPRYAPSVAGRAGEFTGWMLLSYRKPVRTSAGLKEFSSAALTDENIQSFWVAEKNDSSVFVEIDLEQPSAVHAIQVNFHDHKEDLYGRVQGLYHQYIIEGSLNGADWFPMVDRSKSFKDVPNDYVELGIPAKARYIRYRNIHHPTKNLAISDIRIFGKGQGKTPSKVSGFTAGRNNDRRDVQLQWKAVANAQGYVIRWGVAPDKMYNSWMVYNEHSLLLKSLSVDQPYYFTIEAFNENGIGPQHAIVHTP